MELKKLVVAIGIALLLAYFINDLLGTLYKPDPDLDSCSLTSTFTDSCRELVIQKCGEESTFDEAYFECSRNVYNSEEYKECQQNSINGREDCQSRKLNQLKTYVTVSYIILALLGLICIIVGFFIIDKESISSGFIGGGIIIIITASMFAALSLLTLGLFGGFGSLLTSPPTSASLSPGLNGYATAEDSLQPKALPYIKLLFEFLTLIILIVFAYIKLEKKQHSEFIHS